jgi:hypothetical protein
MYTPKYPAVAQSTYTLKELYIYSEYPAVRPAWNTVENLGEPGEKVGKVFDYSLSTPP